MARPRLETTVEKTLFKGYFNYYVDGVLKTHYFERATAEWVKSTERFHRKYQQRYCGKICTMYQTFEEPVNTIRNARKVS